MLGDAAVAGFVPVGVVADEEVFDGALVLFGVGGDEGGEEVDELRALHRLISGFEFRRSVAFEKFQHVREVGLSVGIGKETSSKAAL